jgi:hypothetical protein
MTELFSKILVRLAVIVFGLSMPLVSAMAQEVAWETVSVRGEGKAPLCAPDTVYTSYVGNSGAFIFTNFTIQLPANSPHNSGAEFGACRIMTRFVIPSGYYLAGIAQSTQAGVVKSTGARGEIRTRLDIKPANGGGGKIETRTRFSPADEMNQPLLALNGSYLATQSEIQAACKSQGAKAVNLEFRASIMGQRKDARSVIIISIDSSDTQIDLNYRLGVCPPQRGVR